MKMGAIADDITGATDLASAIRQTGLSVVQTIGLPTSVPDATDVVIISLKIRTAPVDQAVAAAASAATILRRGGAGAPQIYFKYCSTFDSTDAGNIGPIIERLLDCLGAPFTIATPAYPDLNRTVYFGHLFVGTQLVSESSMRDHPLTPMRDPDLVRVLGRQCRSSVGLVPLPVVDAGAADTGISIRVEVRQLRQRRFFRQSIVEVGCQTLKSATSWSSTDDRCSSEATAAEHQAT